MRPAVSQAGGKYKRWNGGGLRVVNEVLDEIRAFNLAYLQVAQRLIRDNHEDAVNRLNISREIAEIVGTLSSSQMVRLASSNMVLCRFRFDAPAFLSVLTHEIPGRSAMRPAPVVACPIP